MSLPTPTTGNMDPAMLQAMDAPLVELAQKSGGDLRKLMYAFFSFLNRRTDFYCVPHPDDLKEKDLPIRMGFKEGDAEKLLLAAFRQFPLRRMPEGQAFGNAGGVTEQKKEQPQSTDKNDAKPSPSGGGGNTAKEKALTKAPKKKAEENPMEDIRLTEEGKQIPVGNGGAMKSYRWTQTIEEITVIMAIPDGTRGKDLDVKMKSSSISIKLKTASDGKKPFILEGQFHQKIQPDESTWSLEGGAMLLVLQKAKKTWWESVLEGDDKIDTTLVDSRRRIDEYDSSTQGAIRKILFDQQQESLGKPTSDQILEAEGKVNTIPSLPAGVEYIDKEILDKATKSGN